MNMTRNGTLRGELRSAIGCASSARRVRVAPVTGCGRGDALVPQPVTHATRKPEQEQEAPAPVRRA